MKKTVLAFDLGASSGRAILADFDGCNLNRKEVHRFPNTPIQQDGCLRWDMEDLFYQVHTGIQKAGSFDSVGFDTWGVDFGLLDRDGNLIEAPVHYRDARTKDILNQAFSYMSASALYAHTGIQILPFNTLYQLLAVKKQTDTLRQADKLLFMPDLLAYSLCKKAAWERSIASTSQMLDPRSGQWCAPVLDAFGIPAHLMGPVAPSGSVIGVYNGAKVIAVAGHDTQCAVAAMPCQSEDTVFLSCGTWSLLGCELDAPVLTEKSMNLGFSNELGANGKINYLKNIIGLWLIQESRRTWQAQGRSFSYQDLEYLALEAAPLGCFIDPDDAVFTPPGDIPARIQAHCKKTGQYVPQTVGEIMRCIYESLALKYRLSIEQLQNATGKNFTALQILGGGAKDKLLCQMTADCTGLSVFAGPVEATALGNIIIQLTALGALPSVEAGRALIARQETPAQYQPRSKENWNWAYEEYKRLLAV